MNAKHPKKFFAQTLEGKPPDNWHPLEEHLKNVAELARSLADKFGVGEMFPDFKIRTKRRCFI
jgi:hypothetical protein